MRYARIVIVSFRHKGLKLLYETGSTRGVQAAHAKKLRLILFSLDEADGPEELTHLSLGLHPLKGQRDGFWSLWVDGNWRVTFRFIGQDVELLDYEDYH
jgi:proteic killer suppression protein